MNIQGRWCIHTYCEYVYSLCFSILHSHIQHWMCHCIFVSLIQWRDLSTLCCRQKDVFTGEDVDISMESVHQVRMMRCDTPRKTSGITSVTHQLICFMLYDVKLLNRSRLCAWLRICFAVQTLTEPVNVMWVLLKGVCMSCMHLHTHTGEHSRGIWQECNNKGVQVFICRRVLSWCRQHLENSRDQDSTDSNQCSGRSLQPRTWCVVVRSYVWCITKFSIHDINADLSSFKQCPSHVPWMSIQ